MDALAIVSFFGFLLSAYAFIVERRYERDRKYRAACDLSRIISCTKAFSSRYGKLLGISNSIIGIGYYLMLSIFLVLDQKEFLIYLIFPAFFASLFLAYLSFIKMKNFCLVCTAIYLVNTALFILVL